MLLPKRELFFEHTRLQEQILISAYLHFHFTLKFSLNLTSFNFDLNFRLLIPFYFFN